MVSTLEADVELQTSALKFLEIFSTKTYELATISPDIIQSLEIVSGDWGTAGFTFVIYYTVVILWRNGEPTLLAAPYYRVSLGLMSVKPGNGIAQVAKEVVESINLIDLSIAFKVIEGDLLDVYNSFRFILKLTPHVLSGSVVHWTLEYEKPSDDTPDPTSLMNEVVQVSKDVDAYVANLM